MAAAIPLIVTFKDFNSVLNVYSPPPQLTVSQWADQNRKLSAESSAEPGQWRTKRAEYQRGMMDAVNNPEVDTVVFMTSSQIGKTEVINNICGYFIELDPCPIMVVQPTDKMGIAWSKDRLSPMMRDTDSLKMKISKAKSKDSGNTILHKSFPGGHITVSGANSPASLASRPIRIVLCDEIDRFPASAGTEGDPVELAIKRSVTFFNKINMYVSTPTVKGLSRIEAAFDESSQHRFWVPCPKCKTPQVLYHRNVIWEKSNKGKVHHPETARYRCEYCGFLWTDAKRWQAIARGQWVADRPHILNPLGFHINELVSPWVTMADFADRWLKAQKDPQKLKVFVNTALGETWEDEGRTVDAEGLTDRREGYAAPVPWGGLVLTAGVDIQDDRIEGEIIAWGKDEESWSIEYFTIHGDLVQKDPWNELDNVLKREFEHESGVKLKISGAFIDSGGHYTQQVYKFCKRKAGRRIFACKGSSTAGSPLVGRPSKRNKEKIKLFLIGTDTAKETIYGRLELDQPGAGFMHFPINEKYDEEYFEQLTAEKATVKYTRGFPHRVWVKMRARNEALDCRVYGYASMTLLAPPFEVLAKQVQIEKEKEDPDDQDPETTPDDTPQKKFNPQNARPKQGGSYASKYNFKKKGY
jgi:phage terminase large subunit GpA-like protein